MEQVQLTASSRADFVADLGDHFTSLGLTLPTITWDQDHPHGHASLVMDDGTRVMIVSLEMVPPRPVIAINVAIEGENAAQWANVFSVPLASGDSTTITATRGDLAVPATARGTGIVRPHTPLAVFAGIAPPPALETDYPEPPEWYQRTPGLEPADEVPQVGTIERIGADRYVCETAQSNVGGVLVNYFSPDALNGGWRRISAGGGLDPWGPATYQLGAQVAHNGEEWVNRRDPNTQAFAPGVDGSGWMQTSNRPAPWYNLGNEGYLAEWDGTPVRVTHNGRLWRNPTDGTFWEPGVAVWIDEGPA
jgi:hypothetical protein